MDVLHSKQQHHHYHQQHVVRWPTDWMHRNRMQLHINNALPPPLAVPALPLAETKKSLSSSSSSSTSGRGAAAPTFSSLSAMKSNTVRSSSAPKVSSGQLVSYASRRHCSPCRKLQQHSPQPRRSCQPGPTPSPDLLLADKAEWKRTLHDTTYRTYKALPRNSRPFGLKDYALLREVFALAEDLTQPEGAEVRLMDVLKAYDMVLQKHAMDPAEDTFYYRMLLKLSLRSEKDWWKRLNQEIVKNDLLVKVASFRSHKLLLCYWLQWRCHHEKGVLQEKGTRKSHFLEGDNNKSCCGFVAKDDKQHADISKLPTLQQHYVKDAGENPKTQSLVPFYNGNLPLEDTVLVMDVVEVPVQGSKSFSDFDFMGVTAAFQAWQRVARQRKKKRNTREKHAWQWRQAVCFNEKNISEQSWGHWRHLSSKRMIQATLWHDNWLQKKCFSLWSNHCSLMRELYKAGEVFHEKKICLSVLTEWKNYASSLKALCKDLCKGRAFWGWRRAASFNKHAAQVVHHRLCLTRKKLLLKWRLRLHDVNQHKDALSQCRKYHQIHVLSSCFQGWRDVCYQRVKCHRQIAICHERRYQRYQKIVMQNWHAWIRSKRSLQQVLSIGLLSRAHYLQREIFCIWSTWLKMKQLVERKKLDVSLYKKRRVLSTMLCAWERQTSKRKLLKDWLVKALKVYGLQLCRKSFDGWTLWQANHVHKHNRAITIMELVCGRHCKQVLRRWKDLADSKKTEDKKLGSFECYRRNRKKSKYWHLWHKNYGYQAAIAQCCFRRNKKALVCILNVLHHFAKESAKKRELASPCEQGEQCLLQFIKANDKLSHVKAGVDVNSSQQNRNSHMKILLHTSKEYIRKWKHFVEIKQINGMDKNLVVKYWSKFWLKTALEAWKIVLQKKKLKQKLFFSSKQRCNEERKNWSFLKLKLLQEKRHENNEPSLEILWRKLLLEKLSLLAWIGLNVVHQEQKKHELLNILQLKRWWIFSMLSSWRAVAQKYVQEKGNLYQNRSLICEKEENIILHNKQICSHSNRSCLQLTHAPLQSATKLDNVHLKLFFRSLRKYTNELKAAKALQIMRKSSLLQFLWHQWKQATVETLQEKTKIALIIGHLSKFPEKHKIVDAFLEVCPRWKSCKGFQCWRAWSINKASKRTQNRRAWEHLASVLYKKALASFQTALTGAQTLRMSIKHFMVCYQVKALLAWRTYSMEHAVKTASKLSAVLYYRKRREMMVLKKWSLYSLVSQRGDFAKKRADVYWRVVTTKKCLKAWIELFLKYKAKLEYFTWMKIRMDFHCLHNVLCSWRYSSQQSISQRNNIDYMREHRRMVCLYQRFHVWVWYIHRRKCLRAAQEMHRRRHLKSFFQSWVCKIIRLKFKKEAKEAVKDHIMNRFCRTAFLIWRDVTVMAGHARNSQMLAANKIRQCRMTWAFSKWKEVVRSLNFINETMHTSFLRRKLRIFFKWFEIIKTQERWSENHISIVHMRQRRQVRIIFQIWLQKTCKEKREREDNFKALMFERKCTLSRVFRRLKGWMHDRQMKEGFSLLACGKLQHVYTKRAFHGWLRQVEIHSRKQAAHHQLQRAWDQHLLSKSFDGMQRVIAENWHLRRCVVKAFQINVVATKVDKMVCLQRQHICRSLLQYWRKRAISCMVLHHNELKFKVNLLRRTFSEWRNHTLDKRRLEVSGRKLSICHSMCLRKQCWTRWQFRTEEAQYKQQFLLFKTFRAWIKYIKWKAFWRCVEQDATLMILQSLQKRVLWGWQSLVREIAIRRDEHQQQRFLQREALVIANRKERRQKLESLSGVFKVWKARVQQSVSISVFSNKRKQHWKGSIWSNWASLASLADCAKGVRHEWIRSILQLTLNVWRKACFMRVTELRKKEADAAQYALWRLKRLVWIQWKSYVGSFKERVKVLQDCLALIEIGQNSESVREMICSWKDYTSERTKRRELSWAAEASYRRHKLADFLTTWHDYTLASKESASSLKGTIQVYKSSNSHLHSMAGSRYRFQQGLGHISSYGNDDMSFHNLMTPTVVIEEVNSPVEESQGPLIPHPSHWNTSQVLLTNDGGPQLPPKMPSSNASLESLSHMLQNGSSWNPTRSIKYLGLEVEDDADDWSLKDVDIQLIS